MKTKITISLLVTANILFIATVANAQTPWYISGNSGTNPPTNFIGTTDKKSLLFVTGNQQQMEVDTNGHVGIAITSTPIIYPLTVYTHQAVSGGTLNSGGNFNVGIFYEGVAAIGSQSTTSHAVFGSPAANKDVIFCNNDGSGFNERVRITSSGNLGVGLTAPASLFHSAGQIRTGIPSGGLGGASATTGSLLFYNSANTNTVNVQSGITTTSYAMTLPLAQGAASTVLTNDGTGVLSWSANNSSGWSLTGNSGTTPGTNFIGTTDLVDWVVKTNNLERMRVLSGGNVGIANSTAVEKLSITESVSTTTAQISSGQASGSSKSYFGNYNDGLWISAGGTYRNAWIGDNVNRTMPYMVMQSGNTDSYVAFATTATNNTVATERVRITKAGNVGVGTTAPTSKIEINDANKTVLDLYQYSNLAINTTDAFAIDKGGSLSLGGTYATGSATMYGFGAIKGAKESATSGSVSGYLSFMTTKAGIGSREWMRINSDGYVGIGTSAPNMPLEIDNALPLIRYRRTGAYNWNAGVGNGTTNIPSSYFGIEDVSTLAARLVIAHTTGNVGIGTTTPASKLDIEGGVSIGATYSGTTAAPTDGAIIEGNVGIGHTTADIYGAGANYRTVTILGTSTSANSSGVLELATKSTDANANNAGIINFIATANASTKQSVAQIISRTDGSTATNRGGNLLFFTKQDAVTSPVERMRIDNTGNVGINTTAPAYKLDVSGDARVTGIMGIGTTPTSGNDLTINGNGVSNTGTWTSDQLFKTNIDSLHNALTIINQLKPKIFYFDTTNVYGFKFPSNKQYGFIAQDLEQVLPELVIPTTKNGDVDTLGNVVHPAITFKTVNYNAFWGILTKGIQELQQKNDSLITKTIEQDSVNTSLQDQLNQLNTTNTSLQNQVTNLIINDTLLQNQLNQLALLINNCCNNNGNNGHDNNLIPSGTNNYKSMSPTTLTNVELGNKNIVVLNQNVPNPFAEQTTITYFLPDNATRAQILFFEQSGKIIKTIDIKEKGKGQLNVFANDLSSGIYTYSLIVDGQVMETKKMIKAK